MCCGAEKAVFIITSLIPLIIVCSGDYGCGYPSQPKKKRIGVLEIMF